MSQTLGCYEVQYPDSGWADQQLDLKCQATTREDLREEPRSSYTYIHTFQNVNIEDFDRRHNVCCWWVMIINIITSFSVIPDLKLAWATKSTEHMPVFWIFVTLLNAILLVMLALFPFDVFILVPNLFGIVCSGAQLIAYFVYKNSPSQEYYEYYDLKRCRDSSFRPVLQPIVSPREGVAHTSL